jgi:hypothetical protein
MEVTGSHLDRAAWELPVLRSRSETKKPICHEQRRRQSECKELKGTEINK